MSNSYLAIELSAGILLLLAYQKLYKLYKDHRPPGPSGLPIIGNIHQIRTRPWLAFTEWSHKYGPLFRINVAGQTTIILNSHKAATDLLDRRSALYSDRPRNIVTRILTGDMVFAFSQIGPIWRRMRKAAHDATGPQIVKTYHPLMEREALALTSQMLNFPTQFNDHIKRASASLLMAIVYGTPIMHSDDPLVEAIQQHVARNLASAAPGAFLVEYFTWMEKLPRWMCKWRRDAEYWFEKDSAMLNGLFVDSKARQESGDDVPCVVATLIENMDEEGLSEADAAWLGATLFSAGAETSSGQMEWFMISMILHPEAQKAAQHQIDDVVGRGRMPTLEDYEHLPYVRALVKELLRWRPVLPLGVPHRLSQDDWYEGHYIPKDSIVIPNVWALNHDPVVYGEDAEEFRPERHLNDAGNLNTPTKDTHDESHFSYGFGKRICVGRHVANRSLFIEIATILWSFDIRAPLDESGKTILPDSKPKRDGSLVLRPDHFRCEITPRFPDVSVVIRMYLDDEQLSKS
ncbi:cytochrome P450 [Favolaschia claudopus]|uniref:Cytochrome P450 n=1 Tax=Favolaschia claudopus TaxID=2862362 RepID=A0AAW0E178_9AGAR